MQVKINEATATQLADFATVHIGIPDVSFRTGADKLRALIAQSGYEKDFITVEKVDANEITAGAPRVAAPGAPTTRRMVSITINEQDTPGSTEGREPVPVQVNGSLMYVPRGRMVSIPYEYFHVLQNAKFRQYDAPADQFSPLGEARDVPRFSMTVHSIDPAPALAA